jgi:hypothetical protein
MIGAATDVAKTHRKIAAIPVFMVFAGKIGKKGEKLVSPDGIKALGFFLHSVSTF